MSNISYSENDDTTAINIYIYIIIYINYNCMTRKRMLISYISNLYKSIN